VLLIVGFFISGGDAPDYTAADQEWISWAAGNATKGRVGALLILLAGFVFLHFVGMIRNVFEEAEATTHGSMQLARVVFAGAVTGISGITMAILMIAGATAEGADANPLVSRAIANATVGPFLVAAMGFAALLAAAGLLTLRSGVFARGSGIVALIGALGFFITFFTLIPGPTKDSVFGYGFPIGILGLAIWSITTSVARYRAVASNREGIG
jgi:hypothetical protein